MSAPTPVEAPTPVPSAAPLGTVDDPDASPAPRASRPGAPGVPRASHVPGACALCACVSARRWYRIDEAPDGDERRGTTRDGGAEPPAESDDAPGPAAGDDDDDASAAPAPGLPRTPPPDAPAPPISYVAGVGTSRERRLPLVLAPTRDAWRGVGARATPGAATLCPHCHVQNEQLHAEQISCAAASSDPFALGASVAVRRTLTRFERIMGVLSHGSHGSRRAPPRARRRKGRTPPGASSPSDAVDVAPPAKDASLSSGRLLLSRSAPGPGSALADARLGSDLESAAKLGQRRMRRWANDRLLRELGGAMSVAEMRAQFSPPPFGAPPEPSPFEAMLRARASGRWTGFHRVDMDKESAFLAELDAANAARRRARNEGFSVAANTARGGADASSEAPALDGGPAGSEAAADASPDGDAYLLTSRRKAWGRVSARARAALRKTARRSPERLAALERVERAVAAFADEFGGEEERELRLPLGDAFARLLAHGVCEYQGLRARSGEGPGGAKALVVYSPPPKKWQKRKYSSKGGGGEEAARDGADDGEASGSRPEEEESGRDEAVELWDEGAFWLPPETTCVGFLRELRDREWGES